MDEWKFEVFGSKIDATLYAEDLEKFVTIKRTRTKQKYKQILQHQAVPCANHFIRRGFIFQQDNDPKRTSKIVKQYLEKKVTVCVLQVLEWPPQGPDINPIEAIHGLPGHRN